MESFDYRFIEDVNVCYGQSDIEAGLPPCPA